MVWGGEQYTGPDFEMDFFGKKIHWPQIMKEKGLKKDEYMPYRKAMDFVRENYPGEPYPYTKMSQDIYDQVAEDLGMDPDPADEKDFEDLKKRLQFFDAIHTHLDQWHGVDGFFVFVDDKGQERVCSFDTTLNPNKLEDDVKADVWIGDAPEHRENPQDYQKWYKSRAKSIASKLMAQTPRPIRKTRPQERPSAPLM